MLSIAELTILDWIAEHLHTAFLDVLMPGVSRLANSGGIWILLGVFLLAADRKNRGTGAQVLLALFFSFVFCNLILKNAVGRTRPFELNPLVDLLIPAPGDKSFPSGHTTASFAAAAALLLNRWKGCWVALGLAVLIAFSRLYLYVHFPTDVLGGIIVGVLCAMLAHLVWKQGVQRYRSRRPEGRDNSMEHETGKTP